MTQTPVPCGALDGPLRAIEEGNSITVMLPLVDESELRRLAQAMSDGGVEVKKRRHHLQNFENCFVGSDAVEWLMANSPANDANSAVLLGQKMMDRGLFHHILREQEFANAHYFYRFTRHSDFVGRSDHAPAARQCIQGLMQYLRPCAVAVARRWPGLRTRSLLLQALGESNAFSEFLRSAYAKYEDLADDEAARRYAVMLHNRVKEHGRAVGKRDDSSAFTEHYLEKHCQLGQV